MCCLRLREQGNYSASYHERRDILSVVGREQLEMGGALGRQNFLIGGVLNRRVIESVSRMIYTCYRE
jgi:hypothetical protein